MAYDLTDEKQIKEYIENLGIEYRFGCFSEKNPEACQLMGDYLEAITKEFDKAAKVYKNNCDDRKFGRSCYKFGRYSLVGRGIGQPDYAQAYKYFDKGCALNDAYSCYYQGMMLMDFHEKAKITRDVAKGMELMEKACNASKEDACYHLSDLYLSGVLKEGVRRKRKEKPKEEDYAVKQDKPKAFKFALQCCDLGNVNCCANVSLMYQRGIGVEKNEELADKYKKKYTEMRNEILYGSTTLTFQQGV